MFIFEAYRLLFKINSMQIEPIIYETTRSIYSVEDKLSIAVIFVFCWKLDNKTFAEFLYTSDHEDFLKSLNDEYKDYEVDFTIRLSDKNVRECFYKTLDKVKEKYDKEGFYKALYEGDEYAIACCDIVDSMSGFDKVDFRKSAQELRGQLSLIF